MINSKFFFLEYKVGFYTVHIVTESKTVNNDTIKGRMRGYPYNRLTKLYNDVAETNPSNDTDVQIEEDFKVNINLLFHILSASYAFAEKAKTAPNNMIIIRMEK